MHHLKLIFLTLFVSLTLAACGSSGTTSRTPTPAPSPPPSGGGGGSTSGGGSIPPTPGSAFATVEYAANWGLQGVNPIPAYEAGGTGAGVLVAVIDSGFDITHTDLQGVFDPASADLGSGGGSTRGTIAGPDFHGSETSGIIVALKNNIGIHGVAFDATVLALRTDFGDSCFEEDGCSFLLSDITKAINYAVANGAQIISISLGGDGITSEYLDALRAAADAGVLIVVSAGNEEGTDPNAFAAVASAAGINGNMIIVGAIDKNTNMPSFSNRAGASKNVYVVAPGVSVKTVGPNNSFITVNGTSFSAPHVAGAAAVLLSLFPTLTGSDLFDILTSTAQDLGPAGVDNTFGYGLIDLGAAILPLGPTAFVTSAANGDQTTTPTDDSGTGFTIAFGDGMFRIDALTSVMMLDKYRRSYFVDANAQMLPLYTPSISLVDAIEGKRMSQSLFMPVSRSDGVSLSFYDPNWRIRPLKESLSFATQSVLADQTPFMYFDTDLSESLAIGVSFGFSAGNALDRLAGTQNLSGDFLAARFSAAPHLAFTGDTKTLALKKTVSSKTAIMAGTAIGAYDFSAQLPFTRNMPEARALSSFVRVERREGRFSFGMTAGYLKEDNAVLGSISAGALSLGSGAMTLFTGARADIDLGRGFAFRGQYTAGWTSLENPESSFVTGVSTFRTSSFSAAVWKDRLFGKRDRLSLALYQPLKVENGTISLLLPTGRNYNPDQILFTGSTASIAPSSRELDVEISYRILARSGWSIEANLIRQFNPGHTLEAAHANAGFLRISKNY